jgi:hypothetical protein
MFEKPRTIEILEPICWEDSFEEAFEGHDD